MGVGVGPRSGGLVCEGGRCDEDLSCGIVERLGVMG